MKSKVAAFPERSNETKIRDAVARWRALNEDTTAKDTTAERLIVAMVKLKRVDPELFRAWANVFSVLARRVRRAHARAVRR